MEFQPICLKCDNFKKNNLCKYYKEIPFCIKNMEKGCKYFSGGEYELINGGDGTNEREIH